MKNVKNLKNLIYFLAAFWILQSLTLPISATEETELSETSASEEAAPTDSAPEEQEETEETGAPETVSPLQKLPWAEMRAATLAWTHPGRWPGRMNWTLTRRRSSFWS
ncbi:MAG: hypothetical protein ACLSHU_05435 [Oscillospiraceae bacterium]